MDTNTYSGMWFATFPDIVPSSQTILETTFIAEHLPLPHYSEILDLCCGTGRIAAPLADLGYEVTGIDNSATAISAARANASSSNPKYELLDMRDVLSLNRRFDGVISMWQSFGYYDMDGNARIVELVAEVLREGGRFILDVYHRPFFEKTQGAGSARWVSPSVKEHVAMMGRRLWVQLDYEGDDTEEAFDWELFTPQELEHLGLKHNLRCSQVCANFDETQAPTENSKRVQLVFIKTNHRDRC